jgi:glycosyltransferase involved in cell wall biosynthesis
MISVIIPMAPNRIDHIELCLLSLAIQTYKEFEVILVVDGYSDNKLMELVDHYNTRYDLEITVVQGRKFVPYESMAPRNRGARLARHPFYVFIDSDIILKSDALELYAEDWKRNSERVICGVYHWLQPMFIRKKDVLENFEQIEDCLLPPIECNRTHNIMKDPRMVSFDETKPDEIHRSKGHGLACFGGNVGYPANIFWDAGGFSNKLIAGLADDGYLGLAVYFWTKHYISMDSRIKGLHIYHERNREWVIETSKTETDKLDQMFKLNQYSDGKDPDREKGVFQLSEEAKKHWGVNNWAKKEKK